MTYSRLFDRLARFRLWRTWTFVILMDVIAAIGIANLEYSDGLVRNFQSKTQSFELFQEFQSQYPNIGREEFVLLEADSFSQFEKLLAVSDFVLELQLTQGISGVASALAVPISDRGDGLVSLLPEEPMSDADLFIHMNRSHDAHPEMEKFLSKDLSSLLLVLQLTKSETPGLYSEINKTADKIFAGKDITVSQTGYPVIRDTMVSRLVSDFIMINIVGAIAGTVIAAIALNSILFAILTAMSAGTALLWVLGIMGLTGTQINVITVALPVLILVLSFADALHLSFETRRQVRQNQNGAVWRAVWRIGPACILASVTTAFAFFVLALSPSALVAEMGRAGFMAALLSVTAVLIVHPMLYSTLALIKPLDGLFTGKKGSPSLAANWTWLPMIAQRAPRSVSSIAAVALALSLSAYFTVQTNFSLFENFGPNDPLRQTVNKIEKEFGPVGALYFSAQIDPENQVVDIAKAGPILERHSGGKAVVSIASLTDSTDIGALPIELRNRFLSVDGAGTLVTIPFHYSDARETRQIVNEIETSISGDARARETFPDGATGLEAMTAFTSAKMLQDMNVGFLIAVAASGALIAIWLRDPMVGLIALVPNILPIAIVGAWLAWSGRGLEFSSGIALTIAFGLAIDDTVHVINRLRLNLGRNTDYTNAQVIQAVNEVLPTLVITSAVLSIGLIGTQFASLPSLAYFGTLSIAVFVLALLADLVVLPGLFIVAGGRFRRKREK